MFMSKEELYKNVKESTRKVMLQSSSEKEELIQSHIQYVNKCNKNVEKGYSRIMKKREGANLNFKSTVLDTSLMKSNEYMTDTVDKLQEVLNSGIFPKSTLSLYLCYRSGNK